MRGKHHISIQDKRVRYEFDIKRNITIIRGDSATGKTTLIEMLASYDSLGKSSGVQVSSDCRLMVLDGTEWKYRIENNPGVIFFIDEDNHFVVTEEFASAIKSADNYFVIITRDNLPNLPYSLEEIYGIRSSEKYAGLKQVYHEFYHLYGDFQLLSDEAVDKCIVEDSNAGYEFYRSAWKDNKEKVISANGKSSIRRVIDTNDVSLIIADGAAFGSEIDHIESMRLCGVKIVLYLPESFEWLILASNVLDDNEIRRILLNPEDYIDSAKYVSWERFFTTLLIEKSQGTYLQYQKQKLNPAFLQAKEASKVLDILPEVLRKYF